MSLVSFLTTIADAIRSKTGAAGEIPAPEFADRILAIATGSNEAPSISVDDAGLITATAGDKSATHQLPTSAGGTFSAGSEDQTVASAGDFLTGDVVLAAAAGSGKTVKFFRRADDTTDPTTSIVCESSISGTATIYVNITLNGFSAGRELLYLYIQYCLTDETAGESYSLLLCPYDTSYDVFLTKGNQVFLIHEGAVTMTQTDDTLTITFSTYNATLKSFVAGVYSSSEDHYLYLE